MRRGQRRRQIVGLLDPRRLDAEGLRQHARSPGCRARRPACVNSVAVGVVEVGRPDRADRREAEVVEEDPHDRDAQLDRRRQRADDREEAAVADQAHAPACRARAILAPIAAAGANPIVAMPPLVMNVCGCRATSCWPAPFLFQPTSVTKIVSARRDPRDLVEQPRRMDRLAGVALLRRELALPRPPCPSRSPPRAPAFGLRRARAQRVAPARAASPSRRRRCRPRPDRSCRSPAGRCRSESASTAESRRCTSGFHELQSASPNAGADREDDVGVRAPFRWRRACPRCRSCRATARGLPERPPSPSASSRPGSTSSSATCSSSGDASDSVAPLPAKISGADAPASRSAAAAMPRGIAGRPARSSAAAPR